MELNDVYVGHERENDKNTIKNTEHVNQVLNFHFLFHLAFECIQWVIN